MTARGFAGVRVVLVAAFNRRYHRSGLALAAALEALGWTPLLRQFNGAHPAAVQSWIAPRRAAAAGPAVGPRRLKLTHLRLYLSDWIERLTGARLFEYRNYVEV